MEPIAFVGKTDCRIVSSRGSNDFEWDPVFQPEDCLQTCAEMNKSVKNSISHRWVGSRHVTSYSYHIISSVLTFPYCHFILPILCHFISRYRPLDQLRMYLISNADLINESILAAYSAKKQKINDK